jgi:hypothetical protein
VQNIDKDSTRMSMLPAPVSFSKHRRIFRGNLPASPRRTFDILLTQARVTNLGLILLSCFAAVSFLYNLSHYLSHPQEPLRNLPTSITSTLSRPNAIQNLTHLIVVPGHSIWKGSNPYLMRNEDEWMLEPYQKKGGRVFAFINHISRG